MSILAIAPDRPDDWNLPLYLHALGAMVVFGALVVAANYLVAARRDGSATSARRSFRSLAYGVIPAYLLMRISAQWLADKQGVEDADVAWIDIGYVVGDGGLLFVLLATIASGVAVRRTPPDGAPGGASRGVTVASVLVGIVIAATLVAVWAMTTKPV
jgi:hypothetical protein